MGQLDIDPDRQAVPFDRPFIGGLHDAGATSRDDGKPRRGQAPGGFGGLRVERVGGRGAGGADEGDRIGDIAQPLEPLDELAHDPKDPPRVALPEVVDPLRSRTGAEQDFVLGGAGWRGAMYERTVGHGSEYKGRDSC